MASNGTPAATRRRLDYNEEIIILVGSEETRFMLPKTVATQNSAFFSTALSSNFKESKDGIIRLPEVEANTFKTFVQWLYTGEIIVLEPEEGLKDRDGGLRYPHLMKLYILGDQLRSIRLCNSTIDCIIDLRCSVNRWPGEDSISQAFTFTPENSNLRLLFVDFYLCLNNTDWLRSCGKRLPYDFLLALVHGRMVNQNKKVVMPLPSDKCKYHEHNDEVPKCVQK